MSKYTTEVRFICENSAGLTDSVGYNSINEVLDKSRAKVFDFDFPIFDEAYRPVLENKILKHYYTREICCETVGLWKHYLDTRMNEIMPYYNQLYKSALLEFNPLYDVDLTTDYQKVDNGNNDKTRGLGEKGTFAETDTVDETVVLDENKQHSNTNVVGENKQHSNTNVVDESTSNSNTNVVDENTSKTNTTVVDESTSNSNTNVVDENIRGTETDTTTQETDGTNGNTTTDNRANKNDHWEYFSDTPEGGINGVANLNYLTNATHITDDGTGSTSTSTSSGTTHSETETVANKTNSGERGVTTTDNGSGELDRTTTENGSGELDRTTSENGSGELDRTTTDNGSEELDRTTTDNGTNETDATTTKDSTTEKSGNSSKTINENSKEIIKNVEDYLQHVVGKRGAASYSKLLLEYRDTFLNIDLMIIKDLKDLFMNIW